MIVFPDKRLWYGLLTGLVLIGISLGQPEAVLAQPLQDSDLRFHHLTTMDGLSHPSVGDIIRDQTGFMWFGTQNGLTRYDGYEMKIYRTNPDDPYSLNNNDILVLHEDKANNFWVGTAQGLHQYDRQNDRFNVFVSESYDRNSLSDNNIWDLEDDHQGYLWIGTQHGLNKLDIASNRIVRMMHDPSDESSLSSNEISSIFQDSNKNLWIGTSNGLNRYCFEEKRFYRYNHDPENPASLSSDRIIQIYENRQGELWIATAGGGVNLMTDINGSFIQYVHDESDPYSISENLVFSILEDSNGLMWFGTSNEGLNIFDREEQRFYRHKHDPNNQFSVSDGGVDVIYESPDNILWIGTYAGGVSYLDRSMVFFSHYSTDTGGEGLTSNLIRNFVQDDNGCIWIATNGGGLVRFDPRTERFVSYRHIANDSESLPTDVLLQVHLNEHGLWIGTYAQGLVLMNMEDGSFQHFVHDPDNENSLSNNDIFALYEDRDGIMWAGTNGGGLNRIDPVTGDITRYVADLDDHNSILNNDIRTLYEDRQGNFWIGSYEATLTRMDRDRELFFHFDINEGELFFSNVIQDILEDSQGRLWLATRGGGLKLFDRSRREVARSYTVQDGLPGNILHALVEDDQGIIWISTNNGISRFDPERESFHHYDDKSGVQRSDFYYGARFIDRDGFVYFGGFNGFNRFHPDEMSISTEEHPVIFTDFLLYNRSVSIGEGALLDRHISQMDTLVIPYDLTVLTFRFSALNFSAVKGNRFAYILEGFDNEWNYVGNQRIATYTNLPPGQYTLRVMATNNDGVWSHNPTDLVLVITPPFWRTTWFIFSALLAFILMLFGIYRLRVRAINSRNKELEVMVAERTRELSESNATKDKLLSIIGHDLNNVAFGMIGFVQLLKDSVERNDSEEIEDYTTRLYQATLQFHDLLTDLLTWASSQSGRITHEPEWVQLKDLVEDVITHEESRAMNKSIRINTNLDQHEPNIYADPNMLSIVLRNLVNNAVKFTRKGGKIRISSIKKDDNLEIIVSDNGVGMDHSQIYSVLNDNKRLTTKGTENEKGTGLGLSLCKDFIEKNGGALRIESEKGEGSSFIFTVPLKPS